MKLNQVVLLISGMWQLMIILEIFASRGMSTNELQKCKLWWHGPNWLSQGKDNWPLWNVHKVSKEILADISKEIKAPKLCLKFFLQQEKVLWKSRTKDIEEEYYNQFIYY